MDGFDVTLRCGPTLGTEQLVGVVLELADQLTGLFERHPGPIQRRPGAPCHEGADHSQADNGEDGGGGLATVPGPRLRPVAVWVPDAAAVQIPVTEPVANVVVRPLDSVTVHHALRDGPGLSRGCPSFGSRRPRGPCDRRLPGGGDGREERVARGRGYKRTIGVSGSPTADRPAPRK